LVAQFAGTGSPSYLAGIIDIAPSALEMKAGAQAQVHGLGKREDSFGYDFAVGDGSRSAVF
jgi:hypothetical protein